MAWPLWQMDCPCIQSNFQSTLVEHRSLKNICITSGRTIGCVYYYTHIYIIIYIFYLCNNMCNVSSPLPIFLTVSWKWWTTLQVAHITTIQMVQVCVTGNDGQLYKLPTLPHTNGNDGQLYKLPTFPHQRLRRLNKKTFNQCDVLL